MTDAAQSGGRTRGENGGAKLGKLEERESNKNKGRKRYEMEEANQGTLKGKKQK